MLILTGWLEQTCNCRIVPNPNIQGIVNSVLLCRVFHYVHFQCFGELKTRFLDIVPFAYVYEYSKYFRCLEDYYRDVMCKTLCSSFALGVYNKSAIVPNPNFKEWSVLHLFVHCFILFIFCVWWPKKETSRYRWLCINNECNE